MRAAVIPLLLVACATTALPGDRDFDAVVRGLESQLHTRRMRIPLFGLVKFAVRVSRPEGVKQLDLAIFEDVRAPLASGEFDEMMRQAVGSRWQPLVRVRSNRDGERTYIYSRGAGRDLHLMVMTFDGSDATVVRLKVSPQALLDLVDEPATMGKRASGDN